MQLDIRSGELTLRGYLVRPDLEPGQSCGLLLVCHGFPAGPKGAAGTGQTYPQLADRLASKGHELGDVPAQLARIQHQPLPMLILLQGVSNAVTRLWAGAKRTYKPLCVLMQFAPALFPEGDFDRLSELDRQRLVTFLNWINGPFFSKSGNFIVLVSDTRSEINRRVLALPVVVVLISLFMWFITVPPPEARTSGKGET